MWNSLNCAECEEKFSDYLEQSLDEDEHKAVTLHLDSCSICRELVSGMAQVITAAQEFPVHTPPAWLATRIIANTPPFQPSFRNRIAALWQSLGDPRTALAIFTATIVLGWIGGGGVREAVFIRAEGVVSCAYDQAIRSYYRSPVIIEIHSRIDQLMENS